MKFARTYNVRSSEITPEYTLKDYYIGMYFQECFAEYVSSKKLAAFDLIKLGLTMAHLGRSHRFPETDPLLARNGRYERVAQENDPRQNIHRFLGLA